MRLRVLLFAVRSACSAAKADPSPMPPERPRIELRTVKQNFSTIIGAYIRDNEIKVPVAPAQAEDGKQRWLPIEDWAPSSTPIPRSIHSSDIGLWLDGACTVGFALTPKLTRPMFVWQKKPVGHAVWQLVSDRYVPDVSKEQMFAGPGPQWCSRLSDTERDERIKGYNAWDLHERWLPDRFVEYTPTETNAELSVTPSFPVIVPTPAPVCESCIQGNPSHCGSNPARCYQPAGSKSGCCV